MLNILGFLENRARRIWAGFRSECGGSTATIFALSVVPMMLAVGGAVDYARYYDAEQSLQTALDAAVLAGASNSNSDTVAAKTFAAWTVKVDGTVGTPSFCTGLSAAACDASKTAYYAGKVTGTVSMYFTKLVGINSVPVTVMATAQKFAAGASGSNSGGCLMLLNKTASSTLNINGGSTINASSCEIDVASTSSSAAMVNSAIYTQKLCVTGSSTVQGSGKVTASNSSSTSTLSNGCAVPTNPFAGKMPAVTPGTCTYLQPISGTYEFSPGTYCGGVNFNGSVTVTFKPGLYIIQNGSWNLGSGTYTGTGVTFYFADSNSYLQLNSSSNVNFTAPTSGMYSGIVMFDNPSITSGAQITVNATKTLTGLVYLPTRQLVINSGSTLNLTGQLIVDTMQNNGTINVTAADNSGSSGSIVRLMR